MLTSWGSAVWGTIVSWDWQTFGPVVTALAAGLTALATIVYTLGTLLLWGTTRRSVRAMENAVKVTFLQMLYESKRPSAINPFRDPSTMGLYTVERRHQQQYEAALRQAFPQFYDSVQVEEQTAVPEKRQEGQ